MKINLVFLVISFFSVLVSAQETEYGVCSLTDENKSKIESCQRKVTSKDCEDIPSDMRKDCFSEYSQEEFNFAKSCAVDGTKKFLQDTWNGIKDISTRAYSAVTNNKEYSQRVKDEAAKNCANKREVKDAIERFEQIKKNIGVDLAVMKHLPELQRIQQKCYHDELTKGKNLGVAIELPDVPLLATTMSCMSSAAQTEFGCSVVLPAIATGGYGGVKALLQLKSAAKISRRLASTTAEFEKYATKVKDKLTPAELASLKHQQDLLDALSNPEISKRIGLSDAELKNLVQGIIDSDAGKLSTYKTYLTKASGESDQLFNVIKGADNQTPAGRAFQQFMKENEMEGKGLLNKDISNEELRKAFNDMPVMQGYLHELPGLTEAIKDVNAGRITPEQFKKRLGANLFHNGPQSGYWDVMTSQFVPGALEKNQQFSTFFKNTAFQGETTAAGIVKPRYPTPLTKEGFVHTTFDRLSQATSGGNQKIFLEFHNGVLKDAPKTKMSELKGPYGDGLGTIRGLISGSADGKQLSSALQTTKQFDTLSEAISKSTKLTLDEKKKLREIVRASRDRTLAFDDYMKKFATYDLNPDGSVKMITLKDSNGNYLGGITKDTPADEAQKLMEKFYAKEQSFNGDPVKDLMKPRVLTNSEKAAYGLTPGLSYYYCNSQKFRNGKPVPEKGESYTPSGSGTGSSSGTPAPASQ